MRIIKLFGELNIYIQENVLKQTSGMQARFSWKFNKILIDFN